MMSSNLAAKMLGLLLCRTWFRKIRTHGLENIPGQGARLLACTHRNGAVDGLVTAQAFKAPLGIAGKNLTSSIYLRLLLGDCIDIHRDPATPAELKENHRQLQRAAQAALDGRMVAMFPEGTSKLGPTLLPVKKGMAYLARLAVKSAKGKAVYIVPVGLHYERGYAFRSDVEITVGSAFAVGREDAEDLDGLTERIRQAMLGVAVEFAGVREQQFGELFADVARHEDPSRSHRALCLAFAAGRAPEALTRCLDRVASGPRRKTRPPVLPRSAWQLAAFLACGPWVLAAFIANLIPCAGSWLLAERMADDDNVVCLWRLLAFPPLWLLQACALSAGAVLWPGVSPLALAAYLVATCLGVWCYSPWRVAAASLLNLASKRRADFQELQRLTAEWLKDNP